MMLTDEMVTGYQRNGWTKLELFDADEVDVLRRICLEAEKETGFGLTGQSGEDGAHESQYAYQADPRFLQMFDNQVDLRLRHPELNHHVAKAAQVARDLLGPDIRVLWDKTFVKPPASAGTRPTAWHQDWPHIPLDRRGLLTVWVAVDDVPAESGALRFMPGSHRIGPLGRVDFVNDDSEQWTGFTELDLEQVGPPTQGGLKAGEATVHDALTIHGAGPNTSENPRRAWTVAFVPADTLWTGAEYPHAALNDLGMKPFDTFDHPQFHVPAL